MKHYLLLLASGAQARYGLVMACLVLVLSGYQVQAQETRFFEELYDVPVMQGLIEVPEQAMSYDKPEGRISQTIAYAPQGEWSAIALFYKESLTQMGWKALADNKYTREGELLEITYEKNAEEGRESQEDSSNSGLVIRFLLRPI